MRILVVGMPGNGNLGDDLISVQLVRHIVRRWPNAEIGILHGAWSNSFTYPENSNITILHKPVRSAWRSYNEQKRAVARFLARAELILIGGGGLFQDAWNPFTIHNFVKYAFQTETKTTPVWAVGVGFGRLNTKFAQWYANKILNRFSIIQFRDKGSERVIKELGYSLDAGPVLLASTDVVAGTSLQGTPFGNHASKDDQMLGCSIRPWPGLQFDQVVSLISSICQERQMYAALFVFDHPEPSKTEYDYTCQIAAALHRNNIRHEVFCYRKDKIQAFANAFCSASYAIASRYHANILWQKLGTPVIPIAYYPKVARLYQERGGFALPLNDLSKPCNVDLFQRLSLQEEYNLPVSEIGFDSRRNKKSKRWLVNVISGPETVYALGQYINRKARRTLGLCEVLPSDKS